MRETKESTTPVSLRCGRGGVAGLRSGNVARRPGAARPEIDGNHHGRGTVDEKALQPA
jgi:hypothetical protein